MTPETRNSLKAGLWTALWTFIGTFGLLTLTPWVADVAAWATAQGTTEFPDVSVLGYGVVAALTSAVSGLVALVVRFAQAHTSIPGGPPQYPGSVV